MSYVRERYNYQSVDGSSLGGLVTWLKRQFQAVQRSMPWAPYVDTRDFVTVSPAADAAGQFQNAANAVGTGTLYLASRTYQLAANVTIPSGVRLTCDVGGVLQPTTGHTLTVAGVIDPSIRSALFSNALGGSVIFTQQREFRAEWFGVVGDGATDDLPALQFLIASVPDYATVRFSANLQMLISNEFIVAGRRQVRLIADAGNQPDGGGASFLWNGPAHLITGADANITNGQTDLTTTTGKFTADMVGQRIIVAFAGFQNGALIGKIASYVSSTHVVLDTAAQATQTGRNYIVGPAVVYLRSCDSGRIEGVNVAPAAPGCHAGYDAYIANGSQTLNLAAFGSLGAGDIGKMIRVDGAGPGGLELITTITNVSGGSGGPQTVTLAAAASTAIASTALTTYQVGRSATSLPARYGILSDESGVNGVTGTHCEFVNNRIASPNPIDYEFYGLAISLASSQNQEYHIIEHNSILGGGTIELHGDGTAGATTTNGSTTVTFPPGSIFTAAHTGRRIRIPGAAGTGIPLDCKIIAVVSGTQVTVSVAASVSVTNARLFLGEAKSYGIVIGNSPNAKGIELSRRNLLNSHKWGVWLQSGSLSSRTTSFTADEADYRIDATSEPITLYEDNSEQSLRHLDDQGSSDPVTFISPRCGNDQTYPNGGYWHLDQNANTVMIIAGKQDNGVPPDAQMYKLTSSNNRLRLVEPRYASPNPSLSQLGISQSQIDTATSWVFVEGHKTISDAPADIFTLGSLTGGTPQTGAHGSVYFGGISQLAKGMSLGQPRNVGGNTTLDLKDGLVLASAGGGAITITLPSAQLYPVIRIVRTDGSPNTLTIAPQSGTINGAASITLTGQWSAKTIVTDGTNWYAA